MKEVAVGKRKEHKRKCSSTSRVLSKGRKGSSDKVELEANFGKDKTLYNRNWTKSVNGGEYGKSLR